MFVLWILLGVAVGVGCENKFGVVAMAKAYLKKDGGPPQA